MRSVIEVTAAFSVHFAKCMDTLRQNPRGKGAPRRRLFPGQRGDEPGAAEDEVRDR